MACVNLLSSPSPVAIPSSISPFLTKLLVKACQSPSAESIRPIYKVLAGSSPHLLDALPSDVVVQMQDQCNVMLQKLKIEVNGICASFFCLALCAVIAGGDTPGPVSEEQASATPPPTTASTRPTIPAASRYEARKYFVSKRALKTLDFTVLRMIYLCSENCKLSIPAIVESLELSNVILKAVNETDRAIWMGKHEAIISKLVEKVISYNHSPEILCMVRIASIWIRRLTAGQAIQSIVTLFGDDPLPQALLPACKLSLRIPINSNLPCVVCVKLLVGLHVLPGQIVLIGLAAVR